MDSPSWFTPVATSEVFTESDPAVPYNGTEIGKTRPHDVMAERQRRIRLLLENSGVSGATAKEALQYLQKTHNGATHHGNASGALSAMHKAGVIARLRNKRENYYIYVLPEHAAMRPTGEHSSNKPKEAEDVLRMKSKPTEDAELRQRLADSMDREKALHVDLNDLKARLTKILALQDAATVETEKKIGVLCDARDDALLKLDAARREHVRLLDVNAELGKAIECGVEVENRLRQDLDNAMTLGRQTAPRKTITADESAILVGVGKVLERYPSDGTKDSPVVLKVKVKTLRTLAAALSRVVSD